MGDDNPTPHPLSSTFDMRDDPSLSPTFCMGQPPLPSPMFCTADNKLPLAYLLRGGQQLHSPLSAFGMGDNSLSPTFNGHGEEEAKDEDEEDEKGRGQGR